MQEITTISGALCQSIRTAVGAVRNISEKFANMDGFMAGTIGKDAFQQKRVELAEQESRPPSHM